ncbi:MAG: GtrA family protein [Hyphomicrobiales bacterium]|nr:GtrA family protein [Hyphomicrobiales bacterium]MDE2113382.1 GtrA family protein [Hyphomicrobiales bacterium]
MLTQFSTYFGVGLAAAAVHFSTLTLLVMGFHLPPVPSTLAGYIGGGIVSYNLNRIHTFDSKRLHREAGWRYLVVACAGFAATYVFMQFLVNVSHIPWLPAQVFTTGIIMCLNFIAHKFWTF